MTSSARDAGRDGVTPNPAIATAHTQAAAAIILPGRRAALNSPASTAATTPPAEIAANSNPAAAPPAAGPPNLWCAICGNSAVGSPKNSVTKSAR